MSRPHLPNVKDSYNVRDFFVQARLVIETPPITTITYEWIPAISEVGQWILLNDKKWLIRETYHGIMLHKSYWWSDDFIEKNPHLVPRLRRVNGLTKE